MGHLFEHQFILLTELLINLDVYSYNQIYALRYIYIYIYIYTHTHTHTHSHTHTHTHIITKYAYIY